MAGEMGTLSLLSSLRFLTEFGAMGSADLQFILGEAELVAPEYVVIEAPSLRDALDQAGLLLDQDVVGRGHGSVSVRRFLLRHLYVIGLITFGLRLYQSCLIRCRLQKRRSTCRDQDVFVWSC